MPESETVGRPGSVCRSKPEASRSMEGKICMVSGATSGFGAVTARELARLGATVIVLGRDRKKCARQVERIRRETGSPVEGLVADLSSQREIRRLAEEFRGKFPRLDVLVNNAGSFFMRRELTVDGLERTFALNHLAPFLLTTLLLDRLEASSSARVVNLSSNAHTVGRIDFDDLQCERRYDRLSAYSRSKLASLLFTYELARRLEGSRVTVNAVNPGSAATNLGSDNGWVRGWLRVRLRNLLKRYLISPEEGAKSSIYLASSPELEGVTGRYFLKCKEVPSSAASYDRATADRLWRISEELTGVGPSASRVHS
jgi:NAD(P)-dependent dehydrogenase (short-subunit alcohol dehydrogenase family)